MHIEENTDKVVEFISARNGTSIGFAAQKLKLYTGDFERAHYNRKYIARVVEDAVFSEIVYKLEVPASKICLKDTLLDKDLTRLSLSMFSPDDDDTVAIGPTKPGDRYTLTRGVFECVVVYTKTKSLAFKTGNKMNPSILFSDKLVNIDTLESAENLYCAMDVLQAALGHEMSLLLAFADKPSAHKNEIADRVLNSFTSPQIAMATAGILKWLGKEDLVKQFMVAVKLGALPKEGHDVIAKAVHFASTNLK